MVRPFDSRRALLRIPRRSRILRQRADGAKLEIARKDRANRLSLGCEHKDLLVHRRMAEWDRPPTQRPLRLEAAILSRTRSPISSRSNWANDSKTLSVSRPR